tara:strand:- start:48 stop:671 length:624 start_codon:yes stop_codon:yes gene_type:complete
MNFDTLKEEFNQHAGWLSEIHSIYSESLDGISNKDYFLNIGTYASRHTSFADIPIDYFKNTLFPPALLTLNFIVSHKDWFSKKSILDFGCGVGMLSVLLNKIGISCDNYDNYSQTGSEESTNKFIKNINKTFNTTIPEVKNKIIDKEYDVVLSSGCPVDLFTLPLKANLFLWDGNWISEVPEGCEVIHDYSPLMKVISKDELKFKNS